MLFGHNKRRNAFTLVEYLAVLMIAALLLTPAISSFHRILYLCRLFNDYRIAENRIWTVSAILRNPAFYCGLGIPTDASSYKKAFNSKQKSPFNWDGPLSVVDGKNGESYGCLRLAYAYPSSYRTSQECEVGKSSSSISLNETPEDVFELDLYDKTDSVKNWIVFENSFPRRIPIIVTKSSGKTLTVKNYIEENISVPQGDKMLLFRALECRAYDDKFYTKDFRTSGEQPRVNGVCDIRFHLDSGNSMLTIFVIVRGDDDALAPGRIEGEENCDEDLIAQWRGESEYILYCAKFIWNVPNI